MDSKDSKGQIGKTMKISETQREQGGWDQRKQFFSKIQCLVENGIQNSHKSFNLSWYNINKHFLDKIRSYSCLISVPVALCWVGGLTPLSAPANVWWWGGMEIMLTEMSPSLSGLALAARLNKLKILLKGDRSSQNTINNFKMPFQEPARQFRACRVGLSWKESVSQNT